MTHFVRQPGIIENELHIHKLELLLDKETEPTKREIYRKILKRTLDRLESYGTELKA